MHQSRDVASVLTTTVPVTVSISACVFDHCTSPGSSCGGALSLVLADDSRVSIADTTATTCVSHSGYTDTAASVASLPGAAVETKTGRGGFLYLNAASSFVSEEFNGSALAIDFSAISFDLNDADIGKDMFILCHSLAEQINPEQFRLNFRTYTEKKNGLYGTGVSNRNEKDISLYSLVYIYRDSNIFLSSHDGSVDNAECGKTTDPCMSANEAMKHLEASDNVKKYLKIIEETSINEITAFDDLVLTSSEEDEAIVHLNRTNNVDAKGAVVVAKSGVTFDKLWFVLTNEWAKQGSFIRVESTGTLRVESTRFSPSHEVLPSNCHMLTVEGEANLTDCVLSGSPQTSTSEHTSSAHHNDETEMCSWSGSLLRVSGQSGNAVLDGTTLTNSSVGALALQNSSTVTVRDGIFINNNPNIPNYPSLRWNVMCNNSQLVLDSLSGGDGEKTNTSLWMTGDQYCRFRGFAESYPSWFFVPVITSVDYETFPENKLVQLSVTGEVLIPCNLTAYVALDNVESSIPVESTNDTFATIKLNESYYTLFESASTLSISFIPNATGDLLYTVNTSESSHLSQSGNSESPSSMLTIVIVLGVALVLTLILICCIFMRQQRRQRAQSKTVQLQILSDSLKGSAKESDSMEALLANDLYDNDTSTSLSESDFDSASENESESDFSETDPLTKRAQVDVSNFEFLPDRILDRSPSPQEAEVKKEEEKKKEEMKEEDKKEVEKKEEKKEVEKKQEAEEREEEKEEEKKEDLAEEQEQSIEIVVEPESAGMSEDDLSEESDDDSASDGFYHYHHH